MSHVQTQDAATEAYRQRLLGTLGEREPIAVLGRTPLALTALLRDHVGKRFSIRPIEGKWSPSEVLGHLCDCEWVYGYRARLILCEDNPLILGMDPDRWVAGQRHREREPLGLVEQFRALRAQNLRFWLDLSPTDLDRTGQHSERGPESLGQLLPMLAGHDLLHLDQLQRLLMAIL